MRTIQSSMIMAPPPFHTPSIQSQSEKDSYKVPFITITSR